VKIPQRSELVAASCRRALRPANDEVPQAPRRGVHPDPLRWEALDELGHPADVVQIGMGHDEQIDRAASEVLEERERQVEAGAV